MGTTCDARVKYADSPCAVGSCFQSKLVNGKLTVYTILSCCLEQRSPKRVRFSNYTTDEVSELEAKLAQLELANERLKQAAPPLGPSDQKWPTKRETSDRSSFVIFLVLGLDQCRVSLAVACRGVILHATFQTSHAP